MGEYPGNSGLVKDVYLGSGSSNPFNGLNGGNLYFVAATNT